MARLAVSKDYFGAYSRLPRKAQRKADEFLTKFHRDSTAASIHLEPLKGTLDPMLRSARIGDDYRVILRAPEQGDVFLVLWADHHDEAYRWAATKQTAVHPATGSLQIFDAAPPALPAEIEAEIAAMGAAVPLPAAPRVFAAFSDDDLFLAGVPRALVPSVRYIASDDDLDALLSHLPAEAAEVLTGLAAGMALDEVLAEVLGRESTPAAATAIDVADVPAALARQTTQRQFHLIEGEAELNAALRHPLDVWRVFLHPRQRKIAEARTKGPMRVLGSAGTGKTVVAMHRVRFLLREVFTKPDDRILFTTYNTNLADDLRRQLGKLLEPDELARLEVVNIDAWASRFLKAQGKTARIATDDESKGHFGSALDLFGDDDHTREFYRTEWDEVIQEQGITTEAGYVLAVRKHRGMPLPRADRRKLWPVFQAYRESLAHDGLFEYTDVLRRAREELISTGGTPRYQSIVVDETQDLSGDALRLLRAIAGPERPDDLFLVGDAHQRIHRRSSSLSSCGIQIRGRRSQTLRLNYRTTASICRWSLSVLAKQEIDDLDEGKADRRGYVSLREGAAPSVAVFPTQVDEERAVTDAVKTVLGLGWQPEDICVVARTRHPLIDRFEKALARQGIVTTMLDRAAPRPGVRMATMHRVKGLEFPVVMLVAMSDHDVPLRSDELRSDDPLVAAHAMLRELSLVYVAASRARDELFVFATGALTPLLTALPVSKARKKRARSPNVSPPPKPVWPPPVPPAQIAAPPSEPVPEPPSEPATEPSIEPDSIELASIEPADAQVSDGVERDLASMPLRTLGVPTRMLKFADRMGLESLGDLLARTPADLMSEPNLGRATIAATRTIIEALLGEPWGKAKPPEVPPAPEPTGWDAVRQALTDEQRAIHLSSIEFTARVHTFAARERIETLGELATRSAGALQGMVNFGRSTVRDLPIAVLAHLAQPPKPPMPDGGLLACWRTLLEAVDPNDRMILTRRSGLESEPSTLQEIGDVLGVTRERVRQLQDKALTRLLRRSWAPETRERARELLKSGAVPLDALEHDPFWGEASARPHTLRYILADGLGLGVDVVQRDERTWLSTYNQASVDAAWSTLRSAARAISMPAPIARFRRLATPLDVGPVWRTELSRALEAQLITHPQSGKVVAFTDGLEARLITLLSSGPMHIEEAFARFGARFNLAGEAIRLGDGVIGLREHIPDFDGWRARLVPLALDVIAETGPERAWSCDELLDALREELEVPEVITPHVLCALIRAGNELRYVGRLRVALPEAHQADRRAQAHELMVRLLTECGEPMRMGSLMQETSAQVGLTAFGITRVLTRPPFVRMDGDHVGLLARDVPGGKQAVQEALDYVCSVLNRRSDGRSSHHLHQEIVTLSPVHSRWTEAMMSSLLQGDPRLQVGSSGAVGLSIWGSARVPSPLEHAEQALSQSGGRVSVEAVMSRIQATYGARQEQTPLADLAEQLDARLEGDWLFRED